MDSISLTLDVVLALLLVVTIAYAIGLNRRLSVLRQDKGALEKLASSFGGTLKKANDGVTRLKKATDELGESLDERMKKAQAVKDDLLFLIERADTIADRLEAAVRDYRDNVPEVAAKSSGGSAKVKSGPTDDTQKTEAERELLKALQSVR